MHAEGGGDRQAAEAEVAQAVQEGGRPQPDPVVPQSANTEVATPDPVGQPPSPEPAPPAEPRRDEKITNEDIQADAKDQAGQEEQPEAPSEPTEAAEDPQSPKTNEGTK